MPRRNYLTYSDLIEDAKKVNELIGKSLKEEQIINHNGRKSYIPLWNEEAKEILSLNRKSLLISTIAKMRLYLYIFHLRNIRRK